jgi:hypothetical protein
VEARAKKQLYEKQITGLEETLAQVRKDGIRRERILIGVNEAVFREVVSATLPREVLLKDRVRLRIEKAEPYFRYTEGVVAFECRLSSVAHPSLFVAARLAGGIDRVDFVGGRLSAHVKIYYFELMGSALGDMGRAVLEGLVRGNLDLVTDVLPAIEIPVRVEQGVSIKGLGEGPVSVKPGTLPFAASVARVLSLDRRLWISLQVEAGPWQAGVEGKDNEAVPSAPKAGAAKP